MITCILSIIGSILILTCIIAVWSGNNNGWSFLLPGIIILVLGGLSYDLQHPKREEPQKKLKRRSAK